MRTSEDPLWEFSFEGCEMFVVGTSLTYRQRRSRNLGPGIVLIFQPRVLFIDRATQEHIAPSVRKRIHNWMLAYDGMVIHPDIGFYRQPSNHEWKQYALFVAEYARSSSAISSCLDSRERCRHEQLFSSRLTIKQRCPHRISRRFEQGC